MVIRPYGYAIWESMRDELDRHIKRTGHENVYFPLFVPRSLLEKEAEHVEGFNPQVAWVTHAGGEELERVAGHPAHQRGDHRRDVKDWIQSYRDLPLLMNLWNNVVRWELRTRLFLRTTEFLWQEAHTFHATEQEAADEVATGLEAYRAVSEDWLAIPVIRGRKSREREVPGRRLQHAIEAMMRDGKALQAGTSHMLGQNFAKAAGIEFLDRDNLRKPPYGTSWGFSTRMVGATIMAHGDDSGLVLPPNVAPTQLVIVPIFRTEEERAAVAGADRAAGGVAGRRPDRVRAAALQGRLARGVAGLQVQPLGAARRAVPAGGRAARRCGRPGRARPAGRPRQGDAAARRARRASCPSRLADYQAELFQRALDFRAANTHTRRHATTSFKAVLDERGRLPDGAVVRRSPRARSRSTPRPARPSASSRSTRRTRPGTCLIDGKPSERRVLFARAY